MRHLILPLILFASVGASCSEAAQETFPPEHDGAFAWTQIDQEQINAIEEFWANAPADCEDIRSPVNIRGANRSFSQCKAHFEDREQEMLLLEAREVIDFEALPTSTYEQEKLFEFVGERLIDMQREGKSQMETQARRAAFVRNSLAAFGMDTSGSRGFQWANDFADRYELDPGEGAPE